MDDPLPLLGVVSRWVSRFFLSGAQDGESRSPVQMCSICLIHLGTTIYCITWRYFKTLAPRITRGGMKRIRMGTLV